MNRYLSIALLLCTGCVGVVRELHKPPNPYVVIQHSRVVGIKAAWQGYGLQLGFVSETLTLIPCATNDLHAAAVDDEFVLGQHLLDTSIKEGTVSGYSGSPPPPRFLKLFDPRTRKEPAP